MQQNLFEPQGVREAVSSYGFNEALDYIIESGVQDDDFGKKLAEKIFAAARKCASVCYGKGSTLTSPDQSAAFLKAAYVGMEHECFGIIFLDTYHRIIHFDPALFRGTLDFASVYPREVVKVALKHNAAEAILAHNHPSGVPEPSRADESITRRLKDALGLLDIRVLDHIIVGGDEHSSLADRGLL